MVTASDSAVTATLSLRYGFWTRQGAASAVSDGGDGEIPSLYIHGDSFLSCLLWRWNKQKGRDGEGEGVYVQSSENSVTGVTSVTAPGVLGPPLASGFPTAGESATLLRRVSFPVKHFAQRAILPRLVPYCRKGEGTWPRT